jgi:hypothetical protein
MFANFYFLSGIGLATSSAPSALQQLAPILGALVGGLLTAIGGQILQHSKARSEERGFYRDRLADIYRLTNEVLGWAEARLRRLAAIRTSSPDIEILERRPPIEQLEMLVRFYQPSMMSLAQSVSATVGEFLRGEVEIYQQLERGLPSDKMLEDMNVAYARLKADQEALLNAIATAVKKYI